MVTRTPATRQPETSSNSLWCIHTIASEELGRRRSSSLPQRVDDQQTGLKSDDEKRPLAKRADDRLVVTKHILAERKSHVSCELKRKRKTVIKKAHQLLHQSMAIMLQRPALAQLVGYYISQRTQDRPGASAANEQRGGGCEDTAAVVKGPFMGPT